MEGKLRIGKKDGRLYVMVDIEALDEDELYEVTRNGVARRCKAPSTTGAKDSEYVHLEGEASDGAGASDV